MKPAADDLLSFLVMSSAQLSSTTEHALTLRLGALVAHSDDPTQCEAIAVAAMMVASTAIKVAAVRVLEAHGSHRTLGMLRDLTCDGDTPRELRNAAERAHIAIAARTVSDGWSSVSRPKLVRAS